MKQLTKGRAAAFIQDEVTHVDADNRCLLLSSGREVRYDAVSFNVGSFVPLESPARAPQENVFPVKPIVNLLEARRLILDSLKARNFVRVVAVGGGPAGVEVAANAWRLTTDNGGTPELTILARTALVPGFPEKAQRVAHASLTARNIRVITSNPAVELRDSRALLADGDRLPYDFAFIATGVIPSPLFRLSGMKTDADGALLVDFHLQSLQYPEIFGGGDCINVQNLHLAKVGVYAVRQNLILHHNLMAFLENTPLRPFQRGRNFLLILNMGNGRGIAARKRLAWGGRLAFLLKDYIDLRFMRRYQVSGELADFSQ